MLIPIILLIIGLVILIVGAEGMVRGASSIAKKLGISKEEFEGILKREGKFYTAYPNDEKKLSFIYNTYRKLFKKEKLASF